MGVEPNQGPQDPLPDALPLPRLESFVQDTAGNAEPITVNGFPLAARPEHVPVAVDDSTVVSSWPSRTGPWRRLRQLLLDEAPEWARNAKVVDILGLCATLVFANDTPR